MAPIGNSVSLVRLVGSSFSPAAFSSLATCGSCWGIHMPSSACAKLLRMASAMRDFFIRVLFFYIVGKSESTEYPLIVQRAT
ncbi:hypothetical protein D3C72_1440400 [compost metagenome]